MSVYTCSGTQTHAKKVWGESSSSSDPTPAWLPSHAYLVSYHIPVLGPGHVTSINQPFAFCSSSFFFILTLLQYTQHHLAFHQRVHQTGSIRSVCLVIPCFHLPLASCLGQSPRDPFRLVPFLCTPCFFFFPFGHSIRGRANNSNVFIVDDIFFSC